MPGDETRIIDWKATARRGKPIARQYEDERRQQVLIVIDAGRLLTAEVDGVAAARGGRSSAALQLARAAVEHDDNVGLMVFADTVQRYVAPARGRRALRAVLEGLAQAEGRLVESDYPAAFRYLAAHNRKRALTVLFTDVIDRTASEALVAHAATLRPAASAAGRHAARSGAGGAGVGAAGRRRPRPSSARPPRSCSARARRRWPRCAAAGVMVLDVPPAGAGEAVVARYHQLKRRGLL